MTNADDFAGATARAQARKDARLAMPAENEQFLNALRQRWFPIGKTEDYQIIERMLVEAWAK